MENQSPTPDNLPPQQSLVPATVSGPAQQIPVQQIVVKHTGGALLRISSWIAWIGFIFSGSLAALLLLLQMTAFDDYFNSQQGIQESYHSGDKYAQDKIAIIQINGVILQGDGFVKRQIDRIKEDDRVKAVVIRVNSPGGTVTGSDYIYHHLKKLREEKKIPMVVSMGSIAASGGYYVAMAVGDQEKSIFAEPTTTTGSIGVIIPHYDISGLLEKYNIKDDSIMSHPRKQMLSMTRPIPEEHRLILQDYVNESFTRFKNIVKAGRPVFVADSEALDQLATGEIFTAQKAKGFGLVDEIGFIEDAIDRAAELAGVKANKVRVVQYSPPRSFISELSGMSSANSGNINLQTLLELSSPRAYYLATSLPPLVSNRLSEKR